MPVNHSKKLTAVLGNLFLPFSDYHNDQFDKIYVYIYASDSYVKENINNCLQIDLQRRVAVFYLIKAKGQKQEIVRREGKM